MWTGLLLVLSLSTVMGVASFLAGSLPLSVSLSQKYSRTISAIGTGLLVGTCLIIIIPEGIETLYGATEARDDARNDHTHTRRHGDGMTIFSRDEPATGGITTPATGSLRSSHRHTDPHAYIGLALVLGFILMYLIDELPKHASSSLASRARPLQISLANLAQGLHRAGEDDSGTMGSGDREESPAGPAASQNSATTIGLVIHAAADGIALAASSFISRSSTGFVVFLAIMIHKAPAAFGLTSVLLKKGFSKRSARAHLIVFSLAAPVGAIVTWLLVFIIAGGRIDGEEGAMFFTGLLLLFSAGTFLYVAMHTMQESASHGSTIHSPNGYLDGPSYANSGRHSEDVQHSGFRDNMLCVVGMLLPLLAQVGHSH